MAEITQIHELTNETVDSAFDELAIACGHQVLGRFTELELTEETFFDEPFMQKLSSEDVRSSYREKTFIIKGKVQPFDVVLCVMRYTHPEVLESPKGSSALQSLIDDYDTVDKQDPLIRAVLAENLEIMRRSDPPIPDLLRGVDAFSLAELERWNGVYQDTLVQPAARMAAWMIAHERNEPLE